jgi:hypothetical protein
MGRGSISSDYDDYEGRFLFFLLLVIIYSILLVYFPLVKPEYITEGKIDHPNDTGAAAAQQQKVR